MRANDFKTGKTFFKREKIMKLIRFGPKNAEKPGLLQNDKIVDLRNIFPDMPDIDASFFSDGWMDKIAGLSASGQDMDVRIGSPVRNPSKIICLGKNYAAHAQEGGFQQPDNPLIFSKSPNTLNGPFDPIVLPRSSGQVDWEVELAVIIGKQGKRIKKNEASAYIAGYTILNDVSGREAQFSDSQWFRGKSFDTFAPIGPALVTPDEIPDIHNLRLTATVNGTVMQDGNTGDMIFDMGDIIENISEDITLLPGDIISTGTPAGVGIFRDPPITLKAGDVVECRIENIGLIRNHCI
jgi:2-keto-4-pentenoate hydratase/2-oxohepta-3-ene-1,7-dioic acid hydratase in catechol pathway